MSLTDEQVAQRIAKSRAIKAVHIADALERVGCDAVTARRLDEKGRRDAEKAAMVRVASEETWRVVFAVLERRGSVSREEAEAHERVLLGTH